MPKPVIGKKVGKPTDEKPKRPPELVVAEMAVQKYEQAYQELVDMRADFTKNFPEAQKALRDIQQQEDVVHELVKEAHVAVQEAKVSVGPFSCQRKWSAPGYDSTIFTEICSRNDDAELLGRLLRDGVIKELVPDNGTRKNPGRAITYMAKNPDISDMFVKAWKDEEERTPAVTDPK